MAITLPPDLLARLQIEAEKRQTTPADLVRTWLDQLDETTPTSHGDTLLETSLSLDEMEPAIPTEDLSEHFDVYLRRSWGEDDEASPPVDETGQ